MRWKSPAQAKRKIFSNKEKITDLKAIGTSGNLEKIIAAEKFLVDFELKEYANASAAKTSLSNTLDDLKIIETIASQVKEPDRYKEVDLREPLEIRFFVNSLDMIKANFS